MTYDKTRLQALSLINDCYKYITGLTTNGVVITNAIKFVQNSREKLKSSKEDDKKPKIGITLCMTLKYLTSSTIKSNLFR
jgi:hypothetical protein